MKKTQLIALLNRDMTDEHAAIIRYLVHAWMEGEDTPIGASLLSRSREEMWHMHWLGMSIGQLGGEPNFTPAPYPYDPTNRATIFKSYVEYEEKLVPHYNGEADMVDDPHIKRVLQREAWESAIHARKFQRILKKLTPEQARTAPGGEMEIPVEFINLLQREVTSKYNEMLQHVRYSWVFQKNGLRSWQLMDQAMEKMKQLAHFAEDIGGNGMPPQFKPGKIDLSRVMAKAIFKSADDALKSHRRHLKLKKDPEVNKHGGLVINLDLTIQQEQYQAEELKDMEKK
ncbi:MAG: ferritin-like domain-containing protein [Thermodesulfovibrionales bacterium]|nr:ferritin-like domain-containing protein [Thermodesulfovibrionales bacterium]